jgi:hypothetical protein
MKKNLFSANGVGILNMLFFALACLLGADSAFGMAVEVVTDPVELEPDAVGLETRLDGEGAAATTAVETGLTEPEIDAAIAEFKPFLNPLEHDIVMEAKQQPVTNREITHYRHGSKVFVVTTAAAVTSEDDGEYEVVTFEYGNNKVLATKSDLKLFNECRSVHAPLVSVYDSTGKSYGSLSMYVLTNSGTEATAMIINPPIVSGTREHVTIPAGTRLVLGANVVSESRMHVAPDNFQPVERTVYTEKRNSNIVMTDEWLTNKKKVHFDENDLRQDALYNYQVGNEINDLVGAMGKEKVPAGKDMADEYVYHAEGIIRQLQMQYGYTRGQLTAGDLNGIAKLQFTTFSVSNDAKIYCGQDLIEALMNIDFTVHKEIKFETVDEAGMTINAWRNNFGKLRFVYNPVMDLLGLEAYGVCVDIKNAVHYIQRGQRTFHIDMKKGAGENYEASRDVYTKTECICLKGYNSILIGPSDEIVDVASTFGNISLYATSWDGVSESYSPSDGDYVYLTDDATLSGTAFSQGSLIHYEDGTWVAAKKTLIA